MKLSGVAATIEIACATTSGTSVAETSVCDTASAKKNAAVLTAKKRAAWKPAWPSRAPKVQCRFHQKLFSTAKRKAIVALRRWPIPIGSRAGPETPGVTAEPG